MVTSISRRPTLTRRKRSISFPSVVSGAPFTSSQPSSRKLVLSTSSVSPSHEPRE
jgi:hypothetical protein